MVYRSRISKDKLNSWGRKYDDAPQSGAETGRTYLLLVVPSFPSHKFEIGMVPLVFVNAIQSAFQTEV